ncbi:MAG: ABC transporter ATP-binding protein [Lachnospiraceae bacterium]|nr:ABC transporter ATP-binding protein [Lachnospiraceae bacterium]
MTAKTPTLKIIQIPGPDEKKPGAAAKGAGKSGKKRWQPEQAEPAITVKDLKIRYKSVAAYSIKKKLLHLQGADTKTFEAVRGISFVVNKGQILGITGKNGSGKSTLLRALANIFSADEGSIDLHGHSVSLLAIGVGFNGELTGRENIMISGLLLGFSEELVREKMDDIIEFAGIGDFIDMPVRTYSSGMHSKLAFSITAVLETDIMLIDEVLSVGDEKFKKKSYQRMKELIEDRNRTVVIVSHSLSTLTDLCDTVMWMHEGKIMEIGDPETVLEDYRKFMS